MTQQDWLGAPSWSWQEGDVVVQIHPLQVAEGTPAGQFRTIVGVYDKESGRRLVGPDGLDFIEIGPLNVGP